MDKTRIAHASNTFARPASHAVVGEFVSTKRAGPTLLRGALLLENEGVTYDVPSTDASGHGEDNMIETRSGRLFLAILGGLATVLGEKAATLLDGHFAAFKPRPTVCILALDHKQLACPSGWELLIESSGADRWRVICRRLPTEHS